MTDLLPKDTQEILSRHANLPDNRSLSMNRYAPPLYKEERRHSWFESVIKKKAFSEKAKSWLKWIESISCSRFHAQLQSRLLVNMAGGVMENAGICLDRFGMPYIPGSAIKGCARRMAIHQLSTATDPEAKAELLFQIAITFGWVSNDWLPGRALNRKTKREENSISDFWWAMAQDTGDHSADESRNLVWEQVSERTAKKLFEELGRSPKESDEPFATQLPSFAGRISFLPAQPLTLTVSGLAINQPAPGALVLDVLTSHHSEYYQSSPTKPVALDNENPIPVIFPSVETGHAFTFALLGLGSTKTPLFNQAESWLKSGLEQFGIGAKTNAGYGWFDCSEGTHKQVECCIESHYERERESEIKRLEIERQKAQEKKREEKNREENKRLDAMTPEEREDDKLNRMKEDQLLNYFLRFSNLSKDKIEAVYRLLKKNERGLWQEIREKANSKNRRERDRWKPFTDHMFKLAKNKKEKMPR